MPERLAQVVPPDFAPASHLSPLRRCAACLAIATVVWGLSGCSLFVMAGKMLFGDPVLKSAFEHTTGTDLEKQDKAVLIVATTPQSVKQSRPGVDFEMVDRVTRQLKSKGIKVYPSRDVLTWLDDRGGRWDDANEIAQAFDAGHIIHIEVDRFTTREENSTDLFRGNVGGNARAYKVEKVGDKRVARVIFSREFSTVYPTHHPKQSHQISERIFQEEFLGRVCVQVSQFFYDHRPSETVH